MTTIEENKAMIDAFLHRYEHIDSDRNGNWFMVPKEEIVSNDYVISPAYYSKKSASDEMNVSTEDLLSQMKQSENTFCELLKQFEEKLYEHR